MVAIAFIVYKRENNKGASNAFKRLILPLTLKKENIATYSLINSHTNPVNKARNMTMKTLLCLGYGYSASYLSPLLQEHGWHIIGATRNPQKAHQIQQANIEPLLWPSDLTQALEKSSHILVSSAPDEQGDPFLQSAREQIIASSPTWVGYFSTTGVYGHQAGNWVDESSPLNPGTTRGVNRVIAERQWHETGLPVHIFRLAGIYGPDRGPFEKVIAGKAKRIVKPGQFFSRIHVEDIAQSVFSSIMNPKPGEIYNLCDDEPAPPEDVISYAAQLLNIPLPPPVSFEQAQMSEMGRSFYSESKRVRNTKIKSDLGVSLHYPTYKEGLSALHENLKSKG